MSNKESCCRFVVRSHVCRCFSFNVAVLSKTHFTLLVMLGWCCFSFYIKSYVTLVAGSLYILCHDKNKVGVLATLSMIHIYNTLLCRACHYNYYYSMCEDWWFFIVVDGTVLYNKADRLKGWVYLYTCGTCPLLNCCCKAIPGAGIGKLICCAFSRFFSSL